MAATIKLVLKFCLGWSLYIRSADRSRGRQTLTGKVSYNVVCKGEEVLLGDKGGTWDPLAEHVFNKPPMKWSREGVQVFVLMSGRVKETRFPAVCKGTLIPRLEHFLLYGMVAKHCTEDASSSRIQFRNQRNAPIEYGLLIEMSPETVDREAAPKRVQRVFLIGSFKCTV